MDFKRIVTGIDSAGTSVFLDNLTTAHTYPFQHVPGFVVSPLWSTTADAVISSSVSDPVPSITSLVPSAGETRCVKVTFPPDSVLADIEDWAAVGAEYATRLPGLAETFEPESPGMHTTPTIDYVVVLAGELWLEVDAGEERLLRAGDVSVQNGNRHAWRNKSDEPATILSVMVGAARNQN